MARKIKRLSEVSRARPVGQLIRNNPRAWERVLAQWGGLGINTSLLLTLLDAAGVKRRAYEETLRARDALKHAGPLVRFLRAERTEEGEPLFGNLADQIERAIQNYLGADRPGLPRHRPVDLWLRKYVVLLARLLRARGQSWKGTERAIHELFELAGYGEVATLVKVEHYIREERSRDSKFGVRHAARLGAWFAKSD